MQQIAASAKLLILFVTVVTIWAIYISLKQEIPLWWNDKTPSDGAIIRGAETVLADHAPKYFKLDSVNHVLFVERGTQERHKAYVDVTFEADVDFYDTGDYRSGLKKATNDASTTFHLKYPKGTEVTYLWPVTCSAVRCYGLYGQTPVARKNLSMMDDLGHQSSVTWIRERYPKATFFDEDGDTVVFAPTPTVEPSKTSSEPGISRSQKAKI